MTKVLTTGTGQMGDLVAFSAQLQRRLESSMATGRRKEKGQVFTPPAVAQFMGSLFTRLPNRRLKLLDPGAGVGILSAAVCQRIQQLADPYSCELHVFETDAGMTRLLQENLLQCQSALARSGHALDFTIHHGDFVLAAGGPAHRASFFDEDGCLCGFDAVIMNPPYFKIRGDSLHARVMPEVVHGQPNIYALFLANAAKMLRPGGELVAITPRSFCNGLYFRQFRRWFFARMALRHIHLFESRTDTFAGANVLQESVITLAKRADSPLPTITVSTSFGSDLATEPTIRSFPTRQILDATCDDFVMRIPTSTAEEKLLKVVESWPNRFTTVGLRVSTGPVVLFRAKKYLLHHANGENWVPLFLVHNVKPFATTWPLGKRNKPAAFQVCADSLRLLVPTRNYVLLRRFSAKEERRRLTASCYLKDDSSPPYLALENHLNYIYHSRRELSVNETYGLAALFNSALLDGYFRILSGNTQVNANEIRTMPFPDLETVARIGKRIRAMGKLDAGAVEKIVLGELDIGTALPRYLTELGE